MANSPKVQTLIPEEFSILRKFLSKYADQLSKLFQIKKWDPPQPNPLSDEPFLLDKDGSHSFIGLLQKANLVFGANKTALRIIDRIELQNAGEVYKVFSIADPPIRKDPETRVFPWPDEAELILNHLKEDMAAFNQHGKSILDLCTAPGRIANSLGFLCPRAQILGSDVNEKGIAYCEFNKMLNFAQTDKAGPRFAVSDGFDQLGNAKYDLIIVNPPTTIASNEYGHSAGGKDGVQIARNLFVESIERLKPNGRIVLLMYFLGNKDDVPKLRDFLNQSVGSGAGDEGVIQLNEKVMRLGMKKAFPSPMPIRYWILRKCDPAYLAFQEAGQYWEEMSRIVEEGRKEIEDYYSQGKTHLHYVIVDVVPDKYKV